MNEVAAAMAAIMKASELTLEDLAAYLEDEAVEIAPVDGAPSPQPGFAPVRPNSSRSADRSVVVARTDRAVLLTRSVTRREASARLAPSPVGSWPA